MIPVAAIPSFRHPCDPRKPGQALWCGGDAPLDFDYVEPRDLDEAIAALHGANGSARIIAGGQSLLPALRSGMLEAARLVSLRQIPQLKRVDVRHGVMSIGSEVTFNEYLDSPHADVLLLLTQAIGEVGSHTIRNRTSFGGTIAWSNPMGALLLALAMLDATVVTTQRRLRSTECSAGVLRNNLAPDEIIVAVEIPIPAESVRYGFHKTKARSSGGKALASMAVALDAGPHGRSLRVGVVGLRDRPWVSGWLSLAARSAIEDGIDALLATAPVEAPFDPLLPSPAYVKASARLVCLRLAEELDHA